MIDLPQVPVQVTEHAYVARTRPPCRRRWIPQGPTQDMVMGKQRLGVNVLGLLPRLVLQSRLN